MQTRKYPRTMQEAFGPYTSNRIEERNEFRWTPIRIVMTLTYLTAFVTLICVLHGSVK